MQTMTPVQGSPAHTVGIEWWCHSCKTPYVMTWEELDALRASGGSNRVLCRCKRWIGNISTHSVSTGYVKQG
jgi:hypothetical protein